MSNNTVKKEPYKLFNLPWYLFGIFAVVVLIATFMGVLPAGMAGCFALMIVLGAVLNEIGDHTPIVKDYLGGGAIVIIFGCSALNYFNLIPETVVTNITSFFKPTGAAGQGRSPLLPRHLRRPDPVLRPVLCSGPADGLWLVQRSAADRSAHHGRRHGRRRYPPVQDLRVCRHYDC